MNRIKSLIIIGILTILLASCQNNAKIGKPVSNGEYTITVTSIEMRELATTDKSVLLVVMVDIEAPYLTESIVSAGASVTDSEGDVRQTYVYGVDYGIDETHQQAYFEFDVRKSAKGFKFHFRDFPPVDLEKVSEFWVIVLVIGAVAISVSGANLVNNISSGKMRLSFRAVGNHIIAGVVTTIVFIIVAYPISFINTNAGFIIGAIVATIIGTGLLSSLSKK